MCVKKKICEISSSYYSYETLLFYKNIVITRDDKVNSVIYQLSIC